MELHSRMVEVFLIIFRYMWYSWWAVVCYRKLIIGYLIFWSNNVLEYLEFMYRKEYYFRGITSSITVYSIASITSFTSTAKSSIPCIFLRRSKEAFSLSIFIKIQ